MKVSHYKASGFISALTMLLPVLGYAFDSGSTEADGAFSPVVSTEVQIPASGIFNFTTVNIPSGVTITFAKNARNTPVTILASGDVTIAGIINLDGSRSTDVGAAGDGNIGDDGLPGSGGPGGFDGGRGGQPGNNDAIRRGGNGLGPGAGSSTGTYVVSYRGGGGCSASGASYSTSGGGTFNNGTGTCPIFSAGPTYGSTTLLPLIGGSGGGGGAGGVSFGGSGGGGGGGAILIASSGIVTVSGSILARGGNSGNTGGTGRGGLGGGGSGGAIRIVATSIAGNGTINADNGVSGGGAVFGAGAGGDGRIRLESENFTRTAGTTPTFSFSDPSDIFVAGMPSINITSVAGVAAPSEPTGTADIILPESTPNPVTVEFASSNVPVGNTIALRVVPVNAAPTTTLSNALSGTDAAATASATVNLPSGPSTLQASVSFTVTAALGDFFSNYAMGERVERVRVTAIPGQGSETTFITISGKEFTVPSNAVAMQ